MGLRGTDVVTNLCHGHRPPTSGVFQHRTNRCKRPRQPGDESPGACMGTRQHPPTSQLPSPGHRLVPACLQALRIHRRVVPARRSDQRSRMELRRRPTGRERAPDRSARTECFASARPDEAERVSNHVVVRGAVHGRAVSRLAARRIRRWRSCKRPDRPADLPR